MELVAKIDDLGRPAWIALMILGFILFWPIGLAILIYLIWSGRMGCAQHRGPGRWYRGEGAERLRAFRDWRGVGPRRSSGNRAFDEYREDMLRRLEEEQKEFQDFLDRLRHARDKQEFDQFMAERRNRRDEPPAPEAGDPASPVPQS